MGCRDRCRRRMRAERGSGNSEFALGGLAAVERVHGRRSGAALGGALETLCAYAAGRALCPGIALQDVTVTDAVARPVVFPITRPRTLIEVLSMAGGLAAKARSPC